jgi:hypothetical protein
MFDLLTHGLEGGRLVHSALQAAGTNVTSAVTNFGVDPQRKGIRTFEHVASDVDRLLFGRDIDGSDTRPVHLHGGRGVKTFEHGPLASDVDAVVLGHDIDGSDARRGPVRAVGGIGIRTFEDRPLASHVDSVVLERDIDGSDARTGPVRAVDGSGIRTFEHGPLASYVDAVVLGHDIDGSDLRRELVPVVRGRRTFEHGPLASDVDSVVLGHDIDGSDARKTQVRGVGAAGLGNRLANNDYVISIGQTAEGSVQDSRKALAIPKGSVARRPSITDPGSVHHAKPMLVLPKASAAAGSTLGLANLRLLKPLIV